MTSRMPDTPVRTPENDLSSFIPCYPVTRFGAVPDGKTPATAAIQAAIDACHTAGGGLVWFPAGCFLSGTLSLRSRVTLHFAAGAVLLASGDRADYSMPHLIHAQDADDIALEGPGAIDGNSDAFYAECPAAPSGLKRLDWAPSPLIELIGCRHIRVESLTIRKAPRWTLRPKNCDKVRIRGIALLNDLRAPNSDGIDVDSDRDVIISDCHIEAGDDCIVLKTTDRGGPPQSTENVAVTNCVMVSSASALKLGTESLGDFRNCVFSNCVIRHSRTGIALLAKDGGTMESIQFNNITMSTAPKWGQGVEWPIVIDSEQRHPDSRLSIIRDISISDVTLTTRGRILVQGQAGAPVDGLVLRNITMRITGYEAVEGAAKLSGGRRSNQNVLDLGNTPAALILAHLKGLFLDGVTVKWPDVPDAPVRHAVYGQYLQDCDLGGLRGGACGGTDVEAVVIAGA